MICGSLTYVVLLILGIPFAGLIALFVGLADLVPLVGATIGGAVAVIAGFLHSTTAGDGPLGRADMVRDRIGWCSCGRSGRQHHSRVSPPGEESERYVRSRFVCSASAPIRHERVEYVRG